MKYETGTPLGRGAMGEVYKAYDPVLRRFVALKYLRWKDPELVERFLREARLQARVEHQGICKVFDVGTEAGQPFIAMQLVSGPTLEEAATQMSLDEKVRVVKDVAEAIHAAHETGLIHRDLKPQNIMLERGSGGWKPFVMDFGLAREEQASRLTETGDMLGTPGYMAPEQARGEISRLGRWTDVYGLGAVLYRLLVGRAPFEGSDLDVAMRVAHSEPTPLRKLDATLPADIETIVMKCLEKEPARRYATAKAFAGDLGRFLDGNPIEARPASWSYKAARRLSKHRALVAVVAIAAVAIVSLGVTAAKSRWEENRRAAAAQRFGLEIARVEATLRQAYLLPLHDTRREKGVVREAMRSVEAQMKQMGHLAEGPGRYALGRGHLALQDPASARKELEAAWRLGYRTPEVAYSLGLALGALFQEGLEHAQRIETPELRDAKKERLARSLRDPALAYLREARGAPMATLPHVEGLIAFYERRHDDALAKVRQILEQAPWVYEAKLLEGDVLRDRGRHQF